MIIGIPRETYPDERRVALVPAVVPSLIQAGFEVLVEKDAGSSAGFPNAAYEEQGASIASKRPQLFSSANILLYVRGPGANPDFGSADLKMLGPKHLVVGLLNPLGAPEAMQTLANRGVAAFALELVPRISRAQPMDVLTAMATIGGYKSVLLAANALPKMFPMMMTAAGTITPARTFVLGAGVAGLQAIATARRLGAIVQAYDVRPAVKEQVESLGGKFVEIPMEEDAEADGGYARAMDEKFLSRQREMMMRVVAESDVVITTAAVPGKKAPILLTDEMVRQMRPGSVIVDMAAEGGGNCELTQPGETVESHGVSILGPVNLGSTIPFHASQMYSKTIAAFLLNMVKDGELELNPEDQIIRDTLIMQNGEVVNSQVRELLGFPPYPQATTDKE
jgi:NAD(P) transhydrogenase subunit alpha